MDKEARKQALREAGKRYYRRNREKIATLRAKKRMLESLDALKKEACAGESVEATPGRQAGTKYTAREIETAKRHLAEAETWIRENKPAWAFMASKAEAEVAAQRHFSMAAIVHEARKIDFSDSNGQPTRINNSLTPAFARILEPEIPGMSDYCEFRKTALNEVMGVNHE